MNKYRAYILLGILAAMLLLYGGDWLLEKLPTGPLATRRAEEQRLKDLIDKRGRQLDTVNQARKQLAAWQQRSLPADTEVARSLYQAWLLELVNHVGLARPRIDSSEPAATRSGYHLLSFSVGGRGTLEQLTKFLFEFYNGVHLHQISSLGITPVSSIDELDLSISIDALAVPGAADKDGNPRAGQLASRDQLSSPWSGRLAAANLDDYRLIADRNIFGIGGSPDAIEHTILDGVVFVDDQPEAWFTQWAMDEKLKLRQGDILQVGGLSAQIVQIGELDVIVELDGQRWLLTLGDSLADAFALPPER